MPSLVLLLCIVLSKFQVDSLLGGARRVALAARGLLDAVGEPWHVAAGVGDFEPDGQAGHTECHHAAAGTIPCLSLKIGSPVALCRTLLLLFLVTVLLLARSLLVSQLSLSVRLLLVRDPCAVCCHAGGCARKADTRQRPFQSVQEPGALCSSRPSERGRAQLCHECSRFACRVS